MHKDDILRSLRSSTAGYVSGAELAAKLSISRTAVWKHIKILEQEGFRIEAVPSKGYRLASSPDLIDLDAVRKNLTTKVVGKTIVYHAVVPSTNTLAMKLAQQGSEEGTVVVAEQQTSGRGRLGRSWFSPKGNLYLSIILRPTIEMHKAPLITFLGAVAVVSAIRELTGAPAGIKWPNDILIHGNKISGILTEMSAEPDQIRHIIIGIGLNVNMKPEELPVEARRRATTLSALLGGIADRTRVLTVLLEQIEHWYGQFLKQEQTVIEAWRSLSMTLGRQVTVSTPGGQMKGTALDVDQEGRLIVRRSDGTMCRVASGDVTLNEVGAWSEGMTEGS